jgi:hypothetical protein
VLTTLSEEKAIPLFFILRTSEANLSKTARTMVRERATIGKMRSGLPKSKVDNSLLKISRIALTKRLIERDGINEFHRRTGL